MKVVGGEVARVCEGRVEIFWSLPSPPYNILVDNGTTLVSQTLFSEGVCIGWSEVGTLSSLISTPWKERGLSSLPLKVLLVGSLVPGIFVPSNSSLYRIINSLSRDLDWLTQIGG